jgi:hypothetical protein
MSIQPKEPWYAPFQTETWIFTINPANMGFMLIVFLSLGLLVHSRVKTKVPGTQEKEFFSLSPTQEVSPVTSIPGLQYEPTSIKRRIVAAYLSGLQTVEQKTDTYLTAHTTLREFLTATIPQLPGDFVSFADLTTIAEVALYSAHRLDEDIASRAERLAATIKEELSREPA